MKKLYVGNLSFKATEEQIAALFSEIGVQPDSLTLLRDRFTGQPRGFGFAEIGNDAEADKAIEALNGQDFGGKILDWLDAPVSTWLPHTEKSSARVRAELDWRPLCGKAVDFAEKIVNARV